MSVFVENVSIRHTVDYNCRMTVTALSIAGFDPSGGAGVLADIKTFASMGVYGVSAVTALTAQNTTSVRDVFPVPTDFVTGQLNAILDDIKINSAKTGMLYEAETVLAVAKALSERPEIKTVVDPVMSASSGETLLKQGAAKLLVMKLFPIAYLVTPNAVEASVLSGISITGLESMKEAAKKIAGLGPRNVLVKGGHMEGEDVTDTLYAEGEIFKFRKKRINTPHTHGTGCALSAAITAALALGMNVVEAVETAEKFMDKALLGAFPVGAGPGSVDHMAWIKRA